MAFTSTVVAQERDVFLIRRGPCHFEVWRVQRRYAGVLPDGTEVSDGWRPPKTSEWGKCGWTWCCTPRSEELARRYFARLARSRRLRNTDPGPGKGGQKGG